ncbi:MAG: 50S ribosomal protein L33 [Acidimicrobiia bacterium]|nr:50S ribosomal protein L33 [Acidimicrobiia bacterium]
MPRIVVKPVPTVGTGFFYTTMKNQETTTKKLELRKCDPRIRKHVVCTEGKA